MNTKKMLVVGALVVAGAIGAKAVGFSDTFTGPGIDPGWVTDRYEPAGFSSVGGRLEIEISDAQSAANRPGGFSGTFYNTQGRQRAATINGQWQLTGQIEVGLTGLRRGDIWARTGGSGTGVNATYPIFGYRNFDPLDPFNPSSGGISSAWRVWDADTANGWVDLINPVTAGWHDLSISYDGSALVYMLDNSPVYTDTTLAGLEGQLTTVFAQAYNFGTGGYIQRFDNINASEKTSGVPDQGSSLAMLGVAAGSLGFVRRKLKA